MMFELDCISRQAVLDEMMLIPIAPLMVGDRVVYKKGVLEGTIKALPPVTPKPKTGHWTHDGSHWKNRFICSECGYKLFDEQTNFCPNCGCAMKGESE